MKKTAGGYVKLKIIFLILLIFLLLVGVYGYNSGSCQITKEYKCDKNFCLYKEFQSNMNGDLIRDIKQMLDNKEIQKRVSIKMYPENIMMCALPNKDGVTISTQNIVKHSPKLINFYQTELCDIIASTLNMKVFPTDLSMPTSCAILIYEKEGDWINWHYDHNYYNGRFFTVLIPITNDLTCTKFQFKDKNNNVISLDLTSSGICFEGNYLYHRASKLCKNQKRVMLSCQYVTDNSMSFVNQSRIRLKDFAYTGKLF
jgi:hypothetical protein